MEPTTKIGKIQEKEETLEEKQIEWKIDDFFLTIEDKNVNALESPIFSFRCSFWIIVVCPIKPMYPEVIQLYLKTQNAREYSVEYNFGLKYLDGNVEPLMNDNMTGTKLFSIPYPIKLSTIRRQNSALMSHDFLIITCSLKHINNSAEGSTNSKYKKLIKLDTLSENFRNLFNEKENYDCDTVLNVKGKDYKVHRAVLIARSSVFANMFLHESIEKQTGIVEIPDCDPDSFPDFLEFLYCGKLEKLATDTVTTFHLYETSEKYDVQELKAFSRECLIENLTVENLCDVVAIADKYDDETLWSAIQYFLNEDKNKDLLTPELDYLLEINPCLADMNY